MRVKKGRLDNRDVLRYLERDRSSYLRIWVDESREEISAEVIHEGRVMPVGLAMSRNVRKSPNVYW